MDAVLQTTTRRSQVKWTTDSTLGVTETEAIGRSGSYDNYLRGLERGDILKKDGFYFFRRRVHGEESRGCQDEVISLTGDVDLSEVVRVK